MITVDNFTSTEAMPCASRTSTATSSASDLKEYEGEAKAILMSSAGSGTSPTLNVKFQHCDTSGGSYEDVTGASFTQVTGSADSFETISFKTDEVKRYAKVVGTIAGTETPTFSYGVAIV